MTIMTFGGLDADVALHILTFLDVATILRCSRVNKFFHQIISKKSLWLTVVQNLSARGLVDLPEDALLRDLSTDQLLDEVRRVVIGPRTWASGRVSPKVLREITMHLGTHRADPNLLPGGRHMTVRAHKMEFGANRLTVGAEIWDVHRGVCLWHWERPNHSVSQIAVEFVGGEFQVVVCLVFKDLEDDWFLFVLDVDLRSGTSSDRFHLRLPRNTRSPRPRICGDLVSCGLDAGSWSGSFLLRWRTKEGLIIESDYSEVALFPGHVIFAMPTPNQNIVHIFPLSSFEKQWCRVESLSLSNAALLAFLPSVHIIVAGNEIPQHSAARARQVKFSVSESVVHDDTYNLVVHVLDHVPDQPRPTLLSRLRERILPPSPSHASQGMKWLKTVSRYSVLCPPTLEPPRLRSVFRHDEHYASMSASGYSMPSYHGYGTISVRRTECIGEEYAYTQGLIFRGDEAEPAPNSACIAHSGAVLAKYTDYCIVLYYE
ncbi:hypothetical protein B0H14DRAFT_170863 [Mycena olivaceomarginata]|nr:hypothetical protein B0H14DRAFT_170863 [Mycena olivaceomarginata]